MTLTLVLKNGITPRNTIMKYESSITYHSKAMANVNVLVTNKRTDGPDGHADRQTNGRTKNYMPPIYRCGGIILQFFHKVTKFRIYRQVTVIYSIHRKCLFETKGQMIVSQYVPVINNLSDNTHLTLKVIANDKLNIT